MGIDFIDLKAQQARIKSEIDAGIQRVLAHGQYILGPETREFESQLTAFSGAEYALGCANGTDAILLPLMAWGIGPGDAVFCPSFTYCATAEAVAHLGATPVFVDIDRETYNMDAGSLSQAIADVKQKGDLKPRVVMSVDLFGQCADYERIAPIVREHSLKLIADSAQGFGSTLNGHHPVHWADIATTSFFPAKPLGCYGDGGAVLSNDKDLMDIIESLRFHGRGTEKYDNDKVGLNSRLDTLQAAILLPKLTIFADEIKSRNEIANRYSDALRGHALRVPTVLNGVLSTWAQYTVEVADHESFTAALKDKGIPSARYYPLPVHLQTAYKSFPVAGNGLPQTEDCTDKVVSLPMHPYLDAKTQDLIIETALSALKA